MANDMRIGSNSPVAFRPSIDDDSAGPPQAEAPKTKEAVLSPAVAAWAGDNSFQRTRATGSGPATEKSGSNSGICQFDAKGEVRADMQHAPKGADGSLYGYPAQPDGSANLVSLPKKATVNGQDFKLSPMAAKKFQEMAAAAKAEKGIDLFVSSGFRSDAQQTKTYCATGDGAGRRPAGPDTFTPVGDEQRAKSVAPPGYSEHRTGEAADISFDPKTPGSVAKWDSDQGQVAMQWLKDNAKRFDFKQSYTGSGSTQAEPWHWKYTGGSN